MANVVPFSFKGELMSGTHNFANGGDSFKIALYTSNPYTTSSDVALTTNEVSSAGSSYRFQYNTGAGWTNLTTPAWSSVNPQTYPNISGATDFRVMVREASDCNNSPWSNIITVPVITIVTPPIAHN